MVRLKHRYLLAHVLYPDAVNDPSSKLVKNASEAPYTIQFHRPSSDRLDGRLLMQMIRNGVAELFGDYGSGMIAGSLQGKPPLSQTHSNSYHAFVSSVPNRFYQSSTSPQQPALPSSASLGTTTASSGRLSHSQLAYQSHWISPA